MGLAPVIKVCVNLVVYNKRLKGHIAHLRMLVFSPLEKGVALHLNKLLVCLWLWSSKAKMNSKYLYTDIQYKIFTIKQQVGETLTIVVG